MEPPHNDDGQRANADALRISILEEVLSRITDGLGTSYRADELRQQIKSMKEEGGLEEAMHHVIQRMHDSLSSNSEQSATDRSRPRIAIHHSKDATAEYDSIADGNVLPERESQYHNHDDAPDAHGRSNSTHITASGYTVLAGPWWLVNYHKNAGREKLMLSNVSPHKRHRASTEDVDHERSPKKPKYDRHRDDDQSKESGQEAARSAKKGPRSEDGTVEGGAGSESVEGERHCADHYVDEASQSKGDRSVDRDEEADGDEFMPGGQEEDAGADEGDEENGVSDQVNREINGGNGSVQAGDREAKGARDNDIQNKDDTAAPARPSHKAPSKKTPAKTIGPEQGPSRPAKKVPNTTLQNPPSTSGTGSSKGKKPSYFLEEALDTNFITAGTHLDVSNTINPRVAGRRTTRANSEAPPLNAGEQRRQEDAAASRSAVKPKPKAAALQTTTSRRGARKSTGSVVFPGLLTRNDEPMVPQGAAEEREGGGDEDGGAELEVSEGKEKEEEKKDEKGKGKGKKPARREG